MSDQGITRPDCPLHLEVCYPSCHWWRQSFKCAYRSEKQCAKEIEDVKAMREASRLYWPQKKGVREQ